MANPNTGTTEVKSSTMPPLDGDEDFAAMLEESFKGKGTTKGGELKENEIVRGTVVQVTKDYAVVDIGYKSKARFPSRNSASPTASPTSRSVTKARSCSSRAKTITAWSSSPRRRP